MQQRIWDRPQFAGTENDLLSVLEKKAKSGIGLPKIYLACGDQDYLLGTNHRFLEKARSLNIDVTYEEESGSRARMGVLGQIHPSRS